MAAASTSQKTPEEAHAHICAHHGMVTLTDETTKKQFVIQLWGGKGTYMIDSNGDRKFDVYREETNRLGKEYGCHTCGRYKGEDTPPNANTGNAMKNWVCDHQPPLGIIPDATEWRLYAQCHQCSNAQWGSSKIYINSFTKHVGRAPGEEDQYLFWGAGRSHRKTGNYGLNYAEGKNDKV